MTRSPILVAWPLCALAVLAARPALAGDCFEAISEANATKIFDALKARQPGDGCRLESVTTEKSKMRIGWQKGELKLEPIEVVPASCAPGVTVHGKLAVLAPSSVEKACPGAVELTANVAEGSEPGELVKLTEGVAPPEVAASSSRVGGGHRLLRWIWIPIAGGVAAAGAIVATVLLLRRRKRRSAGVAEAAPPATAGS